MKKILTSFLVALSIVAISDFDTSLSTNTSSLQTKQNTLTIMSKAEAAEISEGVAAPDFAFTDLATGCICPKSFPVCVCNRQPVVKVITKKPILPTRQ